MIKQCLWFNYKCNWCPKIHILHQFPYNFHYTIASFTSLRVIDTLRWVYEHKDMVERWQQPLIYEGHEALHTTICRLICHSDSRLVIWFAVINVTVKKYTIRAIDRLRPRTEHSRWITLCTIIYITRNEFSSQHLCWGVCNIERTVDTL